MSYKYGKNNAAVEQHGPPPLALVTAGSSIALGELGVNRDLLLESSIAQVTSGQFPSSVDALSESSTATAI